MAGLQDILQALVGGSFSNAAPAIGGGSPPSPMAGANGPQGIMDLLSKVSAANQNTGMVSPGVGPSSAAPGISQALTALLMNPSRMATALPANMGGMDGSLPMGPQSNLAGDPAAPKPRITLNRNAAVDEPVDAELVSRGTPSIGDRINDGAGDVFAGVKANPASGFASFASGFTGARNSATDRADKKRKDAWATEDRTIAADERVYKRKRDTISDSRSAAASGRAETRAELESRLTEARIKEIEAKGSSDLTTRDLEYLNRFRTQVGTNLGRKNAYGEELKKIDAEVERRVAAEELKVRNVRRGTANGAAAGSAAATPMTGTSSSTTAPDYVEAAKAGKIFTGPDGSRMKWDGSAWVKVQ